MFVYIGYLAHRAATRLAASACLASSVGLFNTRAMIAATSRKSSSLKPRVVAAGVPRRIPLVTNGLAGSKGMVFLLQVIPTASSRCSASLPVRFLLRTSTRIRWLSVPPETRRNPSATRPSAKAFAFLTIFS